MPEQENCKKPHPSNLPALRKSRKCRMLRSKSVGDDEIKVEETVSTQWAHLRTTQKREMSRSVVTDNALKDGEKKEGIQGDRIKVSGSVYRLWSLGLLYLQYLHCQSRSALISAAPWYSSH